MDDMLKRIAECSGPKHGAKKELAGHLGIHPNVITNWFNGRNKSYRRYLPEIAAYYKVSEEYLKGEDSSAQKENPPALTKKDERDIEKILAAARSQLENQEGLMFDGDPASPEAIESILAAMELGLQAAKQRNKEKYTPKKYRQK